MHARQTLHAMLGQSITPLGRAGFEPALTFISGFTIRPHKPLGHRPKNLMLKHFLTVDKCRYSFMRKGVEGTNEEQFLSSTYQRAVGFAANASLACKDNTYHEKRQLAKRLVFWYYFYRVGNVAELVDATDLKSVDPKRS